MYPELWCAIDELDKMGGVGGGLVGKGKFKSHPVEGYRFETRDHPNIG